MRRRVKKLPPLVKDKSRQPSEYLDGLSAPNHLVPAERRGYAPYPTVMLRPIGGDREEFLFVSPIHTGTWPSMIEHPPTWMDPEFFVSLLRSSVEIQAVLQKCHEQGSRDPAKKLPALIREVFETLYIPYIQEQFERCPEPLAEWLIANNELRTSDREAAQKEKPRAVRKPKS